jgi:hypothetical protein
MTLIPPGNGINRTQNKAFKPLNETLYRFVIDDLSAAYILRDYWLIQAIFVADTKPY